MPTFQMVDVTRLLEPLNPQRQETLMLRIEELRDSMRTNTLHQPIGVQVEGESYRIIWGHRRSIAATQLGWQFIQAKVYEEGEPIDHDKAMGAENYHRNATNDKEEALFYKRVLPTYPEGTIGMARELNVPQARIERLLTVEAGDPKVFELMGAGKLNLSQACEINKFESPGYRLQATQRCVEEGASADTIRRWRQEVRRNGLDQGAAEAQVVWSKPVPTEGEVPMANCQIGNHSVPLAYRKIYEICNEHYNVFLEGLETLGKMEVIKEAGLYEQFKRLLAVANGEGAQLAGRTSEHKLE